MRMDRTPRGRDDTRSVPSSDVVLETLGEFVASLRTVHSLQDIRTAIRCLEEILPSSPSFGLTGQDLSQSLAMGTTEIAECLEVPVLVDGSLVGMLSIDASDLGPEALIWAEKTLLLAAAMIAKEMSEGHGNGSGGNVPAAVADHPVGARRVHGKRSGHRGTVSEMSSDIANAALSDEPLLICGEPGTEKVRVAAQIHHSSRRASGPFVVLTTVGRTPDRLTQELFGLGANSATSSDDVPLGRVVHANLGTLFVDDVGDLSLEAQQKLMGLLAQSVHGARRRVGSLDVRVIAASSHGLEQLVEAGTFRRDLYYAITTASIHLRPLRQRKADVGALATHCLKQYAFRTGTPLTRISAQAMKVLLAYPWPNNVRELEACLVEAVHNSTGGVIYKRHLPSWLRSSAAMSEMSGISVNALPSAREPRADHYRSEGGLGEECFGQGAPEKGETGEERADGESLDEGFPGENDAKAI